MSDERDSGENGDRPDDGTEGEQIELPEGVDDLSPFARGGAADDAVWDDDADYAEAADAVYVDLLSRVGEQAPQPRLDATRRVVELLGDPQRSYPIIHVTGTNGKTSTSRIIESILRAYGLRTGLLTSPHLVRVNERMVIDGRPISNRDMAANWEDIQPYLLLVDTELEASGEPPLTYFEALTVLAYASFADAPVDVAVIEVGLGGEWDSTNVGDGQVAVFAPIALDHQKQLGSTTAEIARTKSGIIKPLARVVSARQPADAVAELERAAELTESTLAFEGSGFELLSATTAVGGQLISVRGLADTYKDLFLPLFGEHQAHNAALAIAAVESFLGGGTQPLVGDVLDDGLASATSPGRMQIVGTDPTVVVDAAHNPHGAHALAEAIAPVFDFDELVVVVGILTDKDAAGIIRALAPVASRFIVTQSDSERAVRHTDLTAIVAAEAGAERTTDAASLDEALAEARAWASEGDRRGVLVTGSITLIGEVIAQAEREGWMA